MSIKIEGSIDRIKYSNGDFHIIAMVLTNGDNLTVKGDLPGVQIGMSYQMEVEELDDVKFGLTYKIIEASPNFPTSLDAVKSYIEDLPGIGPKTAAALVEEFKGESISRLLDDPKAVAKAVKGLSAVKAEKASETLKGRKDEMEGNLKLRTILQGCQPHVVKKAMKKWGNNACAVVEENPYRLTEIKGIGFLIADGVAKGMGIKPNDDRRLINGLLYYLREQRQHGHTKHSSHNMILSTYNTLGIECGDTRMLDLAMEDTRILINVEQDLMQLAIDHENENSIAAFMAARMNRDLEVNLEAVPEGLAEDQATAFQMVRQNPRIFVLTGAPGTGKTHLMKAVVDSFEGEVAAMAPTGKAAKRLSQAIGREATTIHRSLGAKVGSSGDFFFEHDKENPLPVSFVVVDEFSMVDAQLARQLLDAIDPETNVLLVGDHHQLPSVGAGSVLRDLIVGGVPHFELTQIKRQNPGAIITSCHTIKDGRIPDPSLMNVDDVWFKQVDALGGNVGAATIESYLRGIPAILRNMFPDQYGQMNQEDFKRSCLKNIQILTPFKNNGPISCKTLNSQIRAVLLGEGILRQVGKHTMAIGDRVLQEKNDYKLGIYNGDTGTIVNIVKDPERSGSKDFFYDIEWDSNEEGSRFVPAFGNSLEFAYAMTIHKSQGSEWPIIIMPIVSSTFYGRQLLYTAISRAKFRCAMLGNYGNLAVIVGNNGSAERNTCLADRLAGQVEVA